MMPVTYGADGIIRTIAEGFLTLQDVERYYADLRAAIDRSYRDWGDARHIIDATTVAVTSADVMAAFSEVGNIVDRETDRLAVVAASGLVKMQAKRNLLSDRERLFTSTDEAMVWLMATPRPRGR